MVEDHFVSRVLYVCVAPVGGNLLRVFAWFEGELILLMLVDCIYLGLVGEWVYYCAVGDSVNCRQTTIWVTKLVLLLWKAMSQHMPDQSSAVGQVEHCRNEKQRSSDC